jgi:5-methyltetrahydropteroyltriglutamate--homocysteine methyltransferase
MQRSERRILTTHAGSLPRPAALRDLMVRLSRREPVEPGTLAAAVDESVRRVVEQQIRAGIDVGNDGEQPRESFATYVQHRLSGFAGESTRPVMRDITHYPSFLTLKLPDFSRTMVSLMNAPQAVGPVRHADRGPVERECRDLRRILGERTAGFVEPFMTAASPGIVASIMPNAHYAGHDEYVAALADALHVEYAAIVAEGLVLQLDCPDLAMERHTAFADRPLEDFLAFVDANVAAINRALEGIPPDRVRLHVCWGNYEGPHTFDVPLEAILPRLYQARVGALVVPLANPRHAHEHRVLARHPLPAGMLLVAGVVDPTTNYVEHPEVVADRLELAASAVGDPHRVIAGTDCGFDTSAGLGEVAEEIVWEKLAALRAGADLATERLL